MIVDLHERGALRSLLQVDATVLNTAAALGEEWLGPNSAILKCLRLGVALHHGALPTAYRKEVERPPSRGCIAGYDFFANPFSRASISRPQP